MHLIESSVWLLIVSMMATLDFGKAVDGHGTEVEPEVVLDNSVFRYVRWSYTVVMTMLMLSNRIPNPFKLAIRPRSEAVLRMLAQDTGSA